MSKVRCKLCGQVLESRHTHDYRTCKCGKTFIDGGDDYIRTTEYGEVVL